MAWFKGNKPEYEPHSLGQIVCEAMYSCNEKEDSIGMAQSTWNGGAIAAKPGINALDGEDISSVGAAVLWELQQAIISITAVGGGAWFADASYDKYTFANLCNDAFGGAGFTSILNRPPKTTVAIIEEILKCLETLDRIRHLESYYSDVGPPLEPKPYRKNRGGNWATRALARAACLAAAPGVGVWNGAWERSAYGAIPLAYNDHKIQEEFLRYDIPNWPYYNALDTAFLYYNATVHPMFGGIYTQPSPAPRLYNISAAQYAAAGVWGPQGTLVLTLTPPAVQTFGHHDQLTDTSWWTGDNTTYYFKAIESTAQPFPEDQTTDVFNCAVPRIEIFYDGTWTYN